MSPTNFPPPPLRTSNWPKTLGIITIIFGVLGICKAPMALVGLATNSALLKQMGMDGAVLEKFRGPVIMQGVTEAVVAVLLLVTGIMLLKRRRAARPLALAYGVVRILCVLGFLPGAYRMQQEIMTLTVNSQHVKFGRITNPKADPAEVPAADGAAAESGEIKAARERSEQRVRETTARIEGVTGSVMQSTAVAGVVGGGLFGLALPVFLLIWFMRRPVRTEVQGWA